MKFMSKKDIWNGAIIWLSVLVLFAIVVINNYWYGLLFVVPIALFFLWVWFGTYYVVTENDLRIKCGPYKKIIPLDSLTKIIRTRNMVNYPALSFNRLEIAFGKHEVIEISPKNEDDFLKVIKEKCPKIEIDLSGLKR